MSAFVLDCSVTLSWAFSDEGGSYVESVLRSLEEHSAYVPSIWPYEVTNGLVVAERRRRIKKQDVARFLSSLFQLPILHDEGPPTLMDIVGLAREHRLSSYDAAYLELALRARLPIATLDRALLRAANQMGVSGYLK